jgi:hypothetical protein
MRQKMPFAFVVGKRKSGTARTCNIHWIAQLARHRVRAPLQNWQAVPGIPV